MPNKFQHQVTYELQGRRIEAPGLPALVLPVNARRWVLVDNNYEETNLHLNLANQILSLELMELLILKFKFKFQI
jgi:hypothetical protein